jgi:hypothetical protein
LKGGYRYTDAAGGEEYRLDKVVINRMWYHAISGSGQVSTCDKRVRSGFHMLKAQWGIHARFKASYCKASQDPFTTAVMLIALHLSSSKASQRRSKFITSHLPRSYLEYACRFKKLI